MHCAEQAKPSEQVDAAQGLALRLDRTESINSLNLLVREEDRRFPGGFCAATSGQTIRGSGPRSFSSAQCKVMAQKSMGQALRDHIIELLQKSLRHLGRRASGQSPSMMVSWELV